MPPRSTSRRNAPQSPPKPIAQTSKTRRVARSASQDLQNEPVTLEATTRGKRGTQQEKSTLVDIAESATGQLGSYAQDEISIAGASDAGHTVQTNYTQFANSNLDRSEMIAALADLQDDSNAFIPIATAADENAIAILQAGSDEGLPPAARRFRGRFKGLLEAFQSSLEPYKDPSDTFINVRAVATSVHNVANLDELADEERTSEALFQLANVTELINLTLFGRANSSLDFINLTFPTPFFTNFVKTWAGQLAEKTVEIALGIRTQYFIDMLYKTMSQPDFDPDYILRSIFFSEDGELLALELTDEHGSMPLPYQPLFEQRIHEIRQHFSVTEAPVNLETLEATFPWSAFREELVQWVIGRANGLNMQIANRGGAKALQIHLQGGPPAAPISEKKRKSVGDKARQVSEMLAVVQANKARLQSQISQADGSSNIAANEIQESPVQTGGYAPANDIQIDDENPLASQQSMQVLETLRLHAVQSNKENLQAGRKGKFVDRQPGAHRIETFDDSQYINATPGPSRKRGRQSDPEISEGSIQFEDDNGPQASKRPRNPAPQDDLAEVARQVVANHHALAHANSQPLPTRPSSTPRQGNQPPSTAPELEQAETPTQRISGGQPVAGTQMKGPQVRRPFTVQESARLVELISGLPEGTMRISWAELEKKDLNHEDGALLQSRGQVGLKDKARNLKMDFLKARQEAPQNFHLIPLGNRLIDQLDKLGVPHSER